MAGRFALRTKVFGSLHEAGAKIILPVTVDDYARGERMGRTDQPLGQTQPIARQLFRQGRKAGGNPR